MALPAVLIMKKSGTMLLCVEYPKPMPEGTSAKNWGVPGGFPWCSQVFFYHSPGFHTLSSGGSSMHLITTRQLQPPYWACPNTCTCILGCLMHQPPFRGWSRMYFVMTLCRVGSLSCSAKALMSIARNCFQQAKTAWCEDWTKKVSVLLSYDHFPGLLCDSRWQYNWSC